MSKITLRNIKNYFVLILLISGSFQIYGQNSRISGKIYDTSGPLEWVSIQLKNTNKQSLSNAEGYFSIDSLSQGSYTVQFQLMGYKPFTETVILSSNEEKRLNVVMTEDRLNLNEVVISGTRYELDKKESPVIVNVLKPRTLEASQSMAISEGLNYQPGVRVETNCQNCGFTQVRLNGLDGAYSQILINNRAVFSALNGVYGLDQIPTNIVERIEIVRSGGSALYGSNAIAGTINIITREPLFNAWKVSNNSSLIDGRKLDNTSSFNTSIVNDELSSGLTLYGMLRNREAFDANNDGFTEITKLNSKVIGAKSFFKPSQRSKLSFDLSYINENRRGGDRLNLAPHLTDITERLEHNTIFYGITYDQFLDKNKRHKLSTFFSGQYTQRDSYYGGLGGGRTVEDSILALNSYGNTLDAANVIGVQYSYNLSKSGVLIIGSEYQNNNVEDEIPGYNRLVDQLVSTKALYSQFEWKINRKVKILSGLRYDMTNVDGYYKLGEIERESKRRISVLSPRLTALYDLLDNVQLRAGYARGFRAPQAFNEDLHISSVSGEARFVILSEGLEKELSDSYTASLSLNDIGWDVQSQILLEAFYTVLRNPFTIVNSGERLANGSIVEELTNGNESVVRGFNIEANFSPSSKLRFENGFTIQESYYKSEQILFESSNGSNNEKVTTNIFLRNPNLYGYSTLNWSPVEAFSTDITANYTGSMTVPRVISSDGKLDLIKTSPFIDSNLKFSYHFDLKNDIKLEFAIGVQNVLNAYQEDFDSGAQRDSDYIYGPARPRTYFFSVSLGNYH